MAEIVNLRRSRKAKARQEKERKAAENRAIYGEPRLAKQMRRLLERQEETKHEGHLRVLRKDGER